jgi:hypothetical protein
VLSAEENHAAESLLADAWGAGVMVHSAAKIWDRSHILRLSLADGRSVVLKRVGIRKLGPVYLSSG